MDQAKATTRNRKIQNGSHLSLADLKRIESVLLRERAKIIRHSAELLDIADQVELKIGGDMLDVSANAITREQASFLATREGQRLREIDEALHRLQTDPHGFGRCEVCNDLIPLARLEFLPTTRRCIQHAA